MMRLFILLLLLASYLAAIVGFVYLAHAAWWAVPVTARHVFVAVYVLERTVNATAQQLRREALHA